MPMYFEKPRKGWLCADWMGEKMEPLCVGEWSTEARLWGVGPWDD